MLKKIVVLLLSLFLSTALFSQSTGKLSGVVTDKVTKEVLPGVNVFVEGTVLGASTDVEGFYVILGVPVGEVTVKASYVGYALSVHKEVRIVSNITKTLNLQMVESVNEGDVVEVIAKRSLFEVGAVNQVKVVDAKQLAKLPVRGVANVAKLSAGVVSYDGSNKLYIRGGRSNQVQYVVDGIPVNLPIMQENVAQYSTEIGGFSARYGSVQSGLVHITTKSAFKKLKIGGEIQSSSLQKANDNILQLYLSAPLTEDLGYYIGVQYNSAVDRDPRAVSHNFDKTVEDDPDHKRVNHEIKPNNGIKDIVVNTKLEYQMDKLTLAFSTSNQWKDYNTYLKKYSKYNSDHNPRTQQWVNSGTLSLNYALSAKSYLKLNTRLKMTGYNRGDGVHFDKLFDYGKVSKNKFTQDYLDTGVSLEDGVAMVRDENGRTNKGWGLFSEPGVVYNGYEKYRSQNTFTSLEYVTIFDKHNISAGVNLETHNRRKYRISPIGLVKSDLENGYRVNKYHNNVGISYGYDLYGKEIEGNYEYYSRLIDSKDKVNGQNDQYYRISGPIGTFKASGFIEDKLELSDFILSIGLRFDGFKPTGVQRFKDKNKPLGVPDSLGNHKIDKSDFEDIPMEYFISPRIGFSFPVTDISSFHAFYGVFRQEPRLSAYYTSWTAYKSRLEGLNTQSRIRDGHIDWEKTDQYEIGYKHAVNNNFGVELTAFYKYQSGLENYVVKRYYFSGDDRKYFLATNQDFAVNKGGTFSLDYRSQKFSTRIDYTFSVAENTGSSAGDAFTTIFRNDGEFGSYAQIGLADYDRTHVINLNADYNTGEISGATFLNDISINALFRYASGFRYTQVKTQDLLLGSTNIGVSSGAVNSSVAPATFSLDLNVQKDFDISGNAFTGFVRVLNVFDRANANDVYSTTGLANTTGFLDTPAGKEWLDSGYDTSKDVVALKAQKKQDRTHYENAVNRYGSPRQIYFGIRFNF